MTIGICALGGAVALALMVGQPEPSTPPRKISGSITHLDYPAEAERAGAQGTVKLELQVAPDGRVSECSIVQSAGHPALDATSCQLAMERFRYEPAKVDGRPVRATQRTSVSWQVVDSVPAQRMSTVVRIRIGITGRVEDCSIHISSGDAAYDRSACGGVLERGRFELARSPAGQPMAYERFLTVHSPPAG